MPDPVVVIGAGPAGLMAAEIISAAGIRVHVYDAMPSVGRKFLRAGVGGLNLTHAEDPALFVRRYGVRQQQVADWLTAFGPQQLRDWAHSLGIGTFVGSSGRVFPKEMKAAPLLRAWLGRLKQQEVRFHLRQRWLGWREDGSLQFVATAGTKTAGRPIDAAPDTTGAAATLLALGGGSWSRLGSNGAWMPLLASRGVDTVALQPSNCGFDVEWSEHLRSRYAGQPVKTVAASLGDDRRPGEFMISRHGVEGGLIYAFSAPLRDQIAAKGSAVLNIDLVPDRDVARLTADLQRPQGRDSLANHLRRRAGIEGIKAALLREIARPDQLRDAAQLAQLIKALPLTLTHTRPMDEAISTAGGVRLEAMNSDLMLKNLTGVFCAGEMLDWEAPTGGYLLTACMASGVIAGQGIVKLLRRQAVPAG